MTVRTIIVPPGVTIRGGGPSSTVVGDFSARTGGTSPVFLFTGSDDVRFEDFRLTLGKNARGFYTRGSRRVLFRNLIVTGNLVEESTSSIALYLANSSEIEITGVSIQNTVGGIYLAGVNTAIVKGNRFERVNFGNIVVHGQDVLIFDNDIVEAGYPGANIAPSGDGVTVTTIGSTSHIVIRNNRFLHGFCFHINARPNVTALDISGNTFTGGVTSSVFLDHVSFSQVVDNTFTATPEKKGWGIAIAYPVGITVSGNQLIGVRAYVGRSMSGTYVGNTFSTDGKSFVIYQQRPTDFYEANVVEP
ncbi:MAG: NosD domain-containing protein [Terriglobales bacterium]